MKRFTQRHADLGFFFTALAGNLILIAFALHHGNIMEGRPGYLVHLACLLLLAVAYARGHAWSKTAYVIALVLLSALIIHGEELHGHLGPIIWVWGVVGLLLDQVLWAVAVSLIGYLILAMRSSPGGPYAEYSPVVLFLISQAIFLLADLLKRQSLYDLQAKADEAERERNATQNLADLAADFTFTLMLAPEGLRFESVSPKAAEILGQPAASLVGRDPGFLVPAEHAGSLETSGERLSKGLWVSLIAPIAAKQGTTWVEVLLRPRFDPETSRVTGALGVGWDITQAQVSRLAVDERLRQLEALQRLGNRTSQDLDPEKVAAAVTQEVHQSLRADAAIIMMIKGQRLVRLASQPMETGAGLDCDIPHMMGACLCGLVAERGETLFSNDISTDPRCSLPECKACGIQSFVGVPLRSGGQVMGVLGVGFLAKSDMRSHVAFLEAAAAQAAAYLQNARLYQSLLHRSEELEASLGQLKAAETQIEAGEQRMQAIFENANDGMGLLQDGLWVEANHRILDMLGYDRQAFLRLGPVQISPALQVDGQPSRETALALMLKARQGQPQRFEWQLLRSNGAPIDCEVTLTVIPQAGPGVLLAILRDVTERRALEAQLRQAQKMEAIGRLAGGIAHDFNNLLTSVLGFADLAMMQVRKEDEAHATIANIALAGQAATRLTRQLLVFARKQVLEPRTLELRAELAAFLPILRSLQTESVQVEQDLGDAPLWVRSDLAQLQQMVMNLAVNARDAMPQGGRMQIRLRAGQGLPPAHVSGTGPWACLSVTDEGVGMLPELVQRLFEPFFTTKAPGKGTGLGLYTVYGILRQQKGGISVQSVPGRGSTFTLWLPLAEAPAEAPALPSALVLGAKAAQGRILLVEDQEPVLAMASAALAKAGFSVEAHLDPVQALKAAELGQVFDLLVTDVVMPSMNGRELAQAVKRAQPGMKVLYISGFTRELIDPMAGLGAGEAMLAKPFTAQALMAKAREVLGQ